MEVHLPDELQTKLGHLADAQGRDSVSLVVEAVERLVSYDAWFSRELEAGLAATDRSDFVEHAAIRNLIDRQYPG